MVIVTELCAPSLESLINPSIVASTVWLPEDAKTHPSKKKID